MNKGLEFHWMLGRRVVEVVENEFSWHFVLSEGGCVTPSCPWRLIRDGHIVLSDDDQGQQFGLPAAVDVVSLIPSLCRVGHRAYRDSRGHGRPHHPLRSRFPLGGHPIFFRL